jgi:hypothetical protein
MTLTEDDGSHRRILVHASCWDGSPLYTATAVLAPTDGLSAKPSY